MSRRCGPVRGGADGKRGSSPPSPFGPLPCRSAGPTRDGFAANPEPYGVQQSAREEPHGTRRRGGACRGGRALSGTWRGVTTSCVAHAWHRGEHQRIGLCEDRRTRQGSTVRPWPSAGNRTLGQDQCCSAGPYPNPTSIRLSLHRAASPSLRFKPVGNRDPVARNDRVVTARIP